ncbi:hypothetical protein L0U88_12255 [Flavihumibacter sp. RY-1]|uniref:Leucine rich repeat (LRR) protein n=1 Tax=Flavihumibacter fluminis TaxID=2909236 RepID=A0ABS9BII0_9BACT|nr:hypothetical protein [Flavihumibacter fluminis]MCF1715400.1 hypothetical protein [Flavihumibacter fluminis]
MQKYSFLAVLIVFVYSCGLYKEKSTSNESVIIDLRQLGITYLADSVFENDRATHLLLGPKGYVLVGQYGYNDEFGNFNQIHHLPDAICSLSKLQVVDLSFNDIESLPVCFSMLNNITSINLTFNRRFNVRKAIPILKRLKNLKNLSLYKCHFSLDDTTWIREQLMQPNLKLLLTDADSGR